MYNWTRGKVFALLAAVVVVTFAAALRFGFLEHDDDQNIVKNPDLQALNYEQLTSFWARPHLGLYIPVTYTYWGGGVAISRLFQDPLTPAAPSPILFHGANIVLHMINGFLLWSVLGLLGAEAVPALFGTLLFLLHPMQVEAVAWITGAKDLLGALFSLAGTYLFLQFLKRDSVKGKKRGVAWPYYFAAIAIAILAILAKPSAVALCMVFFVFSMIYSKRALWQKVAMVIPQMVVSFMIISMTAVAQVAEGPLPVLPIWQRPFVAGDAVLFYIRQILVPFGYGVDYARRPDLVVADPWLCALAVLPLIAAVLMWRFRKRAPILLPAFVIFVMLLAPNLGFIGFAYQFLSTVCDRYAYVAMAVPAFLLTKVTPEAVASLWPKVQPKMLYSAMGLVLALLGAQAHQQVNYWANERTLFQHSIDVEPRGVMAMVGLGNDAANQLKWDDSIVYFTKALEMRPDWGRVHNNLGNSYLNINRLVEATDELKKAIALFPAYPLAFNNLCGALARREMWDDASAACLNALRLAPDFYMSYQNLGYIAAKRFDYPKAEEFFRQAIRIAPTDVPPRVNLVRVLKLQEQWEKAAAELAILTRMRPRDMGLAMDLANCYQKLGRLDQAKLVYTNFPVDPSDQKAVATLHAALDGLNSYR